MHARWRWDRRGQVTLEYFLLFAVIALATVIGLGTTFHTDIQTSVQEMANAATQKLAGPENPGSWPEPGGGGGGGGGGEEPPEVPAL